MANIASAKKRVSVTAKKHLRNKIHVSKLKSLLKKYNQAIDLQDKELSQKLHLEVTGFIDNLKHKGILHQNNADRKKSAAAKKLNELISTLEAQKEQQQKAKEDANKEAKADAKNDTKAEAKKEAKIDSKTKAKKDIKAENKKEIKTEAKDKKEKE